MKLAVSFLSLLTLFSFTTEARASCPMTQQGPPCQEYWSMEAVFIGVANRVAYTPDKPTAENWMSVQTTVYFTIEEAFKGVGGTALILNLDPCGYRFNEGERYLVYAHRNPNNNELDVRVGHTRTRPLSEATEDLQYIRGLAQAEPGSRVFGKVLQHTQKLREQPYAPESLQDIKVTLQGNTQRYEVVSDSEGKFEFKRIPAGTYRLRAALPAYLSYEEQRLDLIGRECAPVDVHASRRALIAGRVLDANGKPINSVPISLVPADATVEQILAEKPGWILTYTIRDGRFRFTQLEPGRYLLVINRTQSAASRGSTVSRVLPLLFYPGVTDLGEATVIVVGENDEPREYIFQLTIHQ
ncbi:MAG TPA: carboxypeptidase-like regulatory domain-containing protein [Pyrinomonadaceae bacterium]|nr:carboxypeptidase-like regulatory domain-containing protein [Pyrinomonadaceae bacterium]